MTDLNKKRILWQSRRGMLELDLLLEPFTSNRFETLSPEQQRQYRELLKQEDQDLFAWLLERRVPPNEGFKELIALILENTAKAT